MGAQYAFHIALEKDGVFAIPSGAEETFVVGVVRTSDLTCEFVEVDAEAIATGKRKGGFVEVPNEGLRQIRTLQRGCDWSPIRAWSVNALTATGNPQSLATSKDETSTIATSVKR